MNVVWYIFNHINVSSFNNWSLLATRIMLSFGMWITTMISRVRSVPHEMHVAQFSTSGMQSYNCHTAWFGFDSVEILNQHNPTNSTAEKQYVTLYYMLACCLTKMSLVKVTHALRHFKMLQNQIYCVKYTLKHVWRYTLQNKQSLMEWVFFILSFDQQHLLWWLISLVQEVPPRHRSQASGGRLDRMQDGGKEQSRGQKPCWEKENLPCAEAEWLEDISR